MEKQILHLLAPSPDASVPINRLKEFMAFGYHQAMSCLFPVFIFSMLALSHLIHLPFLARYDFLLLACLGMQAIMYFSGMETRDKLLVITLFHLLGLAMEIHKVAHGSWAYPEEAFTKVFNVPLYSGFMYASVASYICQAWRRLDLRMYHWPKRRWTYIIGTAIYLNFFTNVYFQDVRWFISAWMLIIFFTTKVEFKVTSIKRFMPMIVSFFLIAVFIWLAENIATLLGAWKYAYQHAGWKMVSVQKLSSWFFLIIVSVVIVAELKRSKEPERFIQ